ncbi:MAG: hypothetical protein GEV12_08415 [Micromonosporaceae bacterium]|nr:hypothetical protein [Micromonosporaceae bacterium]
MYPRLYAVYRDAENLLAGNNKNHPRLLHTDLERMRHELDQALQALADAQAEPTEPARIQRADQVHIILQGRGQDQPIVGVHRTLPGAVRAMADHIRTSLWELIADRDAVPSEPPDDDQLAIDLYRVNDEFNEGPHVVSWISGRSVSTPATPAHAARRARPGFEPLNATCRPLSEGARESALSQQARNGYHR